MHKMIDEACKISIHALREEGDSPDAMISGFSSDFYPRPPRGGRRNPRKSIPFRSGFLSTPSARRATSISKSPFTFVDDFYPRPPRGGRPCGCLCL